MYIHTSAVKAPAPSLQLRRYMPFWQLEDLITSGQLYLRRFDRFPDLLDGLPDQPSPARSNGGNGLPEEALVRRVRESVSNNVWVGSWTHASNATVAHWDAFTSKGDGLALTTTVEAICRSVTDTSDFHIGLVRYLQHGQTVHDDSVLARCCQRHVDWVSQAEVRLLCHDDHYSSRGEGGSERRLRVKPRALIHQIEVSPSAARDLRARVKTLMHTHRMDDVPVWQSSYLRVA